MKSVKHIITILTPAIITGIMTMIISGLGYINKLESQIEERDSLINRLAISDNLVKEYFDIRKDSLTNEMIYRLKPSKRELVHITQDGYDKIFRVGDKVLSIDEIVSRYNSTIKDYVSIVDKYNQLIKDHNELIKDYNELVTLYRSKINRNGDYETLKTVLDLINKNYGITYEIIQDSTSYKVVIPPSPKIDSALMLLPHFRENLKYDKKTDRWMITKQVVEKKRFL